MLFKAYPPGEQIKVVWIIPAREMWPQYEKGKLTENKMIVESIHDFQHDRRKLEEKEEDDLPDEVIEQIYRQVAANAKYHKMVNRQYFIPQIKES